MDFFFCWKNFKKCFSIEVIITDKESLKALSFNDDVMKFMKEALKVISTNPRYIFFGLKTLNYQSKAASLRNKKEKEGIHVPPFLFLSITDRCNLNCIGCFAKAHNRKEKKELSTEKISDIITQAKRIGVSLIFIIGGEPLLKKDFFMITRNNEDVIFPVFTNGTLLDDMVFEDFRTQKNIIPVLSIEGDQLNTDQRRGKGVFSSLKELAEKFNKNHIIWGASITVTKSNYDQVTSNEYIADMLKKGCKLILFIEYVPTSGSDSLVIDQNQREHLAKISKEMKKKFNGIFVSFPGDEKEYGGCLSSGKAFLHISAFGDVEPCPFSPYSDCNINEVSLDEALKSDLLHEIRVNHDKLEETSSGCALWNNKEWVASLADHKKHQE